VAKPARAFANIAAMRARRRLTGLIVLPTALAAAASMAVANPPSGGPADTPAGAQPIARNAVVAGAFQGAGDYFDYYSFTARAGDTLRFTLTNTTSCSEAADVDQDGCPVYGWTADSTGNQIGGSNSGAGGSTSIGRNGSFSSQATWDWKFNQGGTYYVGLQDDEDPAIPAGTPSYTIKVTTVSTSQPPPAPKLLEWVRAASRQRGTRVHLSFRLGRRAAAKVRVHPVGSTRLAASWRRSSVAAGTHRLALLLSDRVRRRLKSGHAVWLQLDCTFSAGGQTVSRTRKVRMAPLG
jgi:hypothetical protein